MITLFLEHDAAVVIRLMENTDPKGRHMEFRDKQGTVFARMAKVYKKKGFLGLFPPDSPIYGELKDAAGTLLLTSVAAVGNTARECKVELHQADGTWLGTLIDAPLGADFEGPNGALLGSARRAEELKSEPSEVVYNYLDAAQQSVGSCDRRYPDQNPSWWDSLVDSSPRGALLQIVTLTAPISSELRLFLHLFPALQLLRFSRNL